MPALVSFTVVVLIPMLIGFFYAFTNWNGIVGSEIRFVGIRNFIDIFARDGSFLHAFGFTAAFSICAVVLVNLVLAGTAGNPAVQRGNAAAGCFFHAEFDWRAVIRVYLAVYPHIYF